MGLKASQMEPFKAGSSRHNRVPFIHSSTAGIRHHSRPHGPSEQRDQGFAAPPFHVFDQGAADVSEPNDGDGSRVYMGGYRYAAAKRWAAEQEAAERAAWEASAWHASQPPLHVALGISVDEARKLLDKAHRGDADARRTIDGLSQRGRVQFSSTKQQEEGREEARDEASNPHPNHQQSWHPKAHPSQRHLDNLAGIRQQPQHFLHPPPPEFFYGPPHPPHPYYGAPVTQTRAKYHHSRGATRVADPVVAGSQKAASNLFA